MEDTTTIEGDSVLAKEFSAAIQSYARLRVTSSKIGWFRCTFTVEGPPEHLSRLQEELERISVQHQADKAW